MTVVLGPPISLVAGADGTVAALDDVSRQEKGKGRAREDMDQEVRDSLGAGPVLDNTSDPASDLPVTPKRSRRVVLPVSPPLLSAESSSKRMSAAWINSGSSTSTSNIEADPDNNVIDLASSLTAFPTPPTTLPSPQSSVHSSHTFLTPGPGALRNSIIAQKPQISSAEHAHHSRHASVQSVSSFKTRGSSLDGHTFPEGGRSAPVSPSAVSHITSHKGRMEKSRVSMDTPKPVSLTLPDPPSPSRSRRQLSIGSSDTGHIQPILERSNLVAHPAGPSAWNSGTPGIPSSTPSNINKRDFASSQSSPQVSGFDSGLGSSSTTGDADSIMRSAPGVTGVGEGWAGGPSPKSGRRRTWFGFPSRKGKERAVDQDPLSLWTVPEEPRSSPLKKAWNRSLAKLAGGSDPGQETELSPGKGDRGIGVKRPSFALRAKGLFSRSTVDLGLPSSRIADRRGSEPIMNARTGEVFPLNHRDSVRTPAYTQPLDDSTLRDYSFTPHTRSKSELNTLSSARTKVNSRTSSYRSASPNPTLVPGVSRHPAGYSRRYAASQPHLPTPRTTSLVIPEDEVVPSRPVSISQQMEGGGLMPPWRPPSTSIKTRSLTPQIAEVEEVPQPPTAAQEESTGDMSSASERTPRRLSNNAFSSSGSATPALSDVDIITSAAEGNRHAVVLGGRLKRTSTFGTGADDITTELGLLSDPNDRPSMDSGHAGPMHEERAMSVVEDIVGQREIDHILERPLLGKLRSRISSFTTSLRPLASPSRVNLATDDDPIEQAHNTSGTTASKENIPLPCNLDPVSLAPPITESLPSGRKTRPRPVSMVPLAPPGPDGTLTPITQARSSSLDVMREDMSSANGSSKAITPSVDIRQERTSWLPSSKRNGTLQPQLSRLSEEGGSPRSPTKSDRGESLLNSQNENDPTSGQRSPSTTSNRMRATLSRFTRRKRKEGAATSPRFVPDQVQVATEAKKEKYVKRRSFTASMPALNRWSASEYNLLRFSFPSGEGTLDGVMAQFRRKSSHGSNTMGAAQDLPPQEVSGARSGGVSDAQHRQTALDATHDMLMGRGVHRRDSEPFSVYTVRASQSQAPLRESPPCTHHRYASDPVDTSMPMLTSQSSATASNSTTDSSPILVTPVRPSAQVVITSATPPQSYAGPSTSVESESSVPILRPGQPRASSAAVAGGVMPKSFAWAARPGLNSRNNSSNSVRSNRTARSGDTEFFSAPTSPTPSPGLPSTVVANAVQSPGSHASGGMHRTSMLSMQSDYTGSSGDDGLLYHEQAVEASVARVLDIGQMQRKGSLIPTDSLPK